MTHPAPRRDGADDAPLTYSIFSVQDHYPELGKSLAQFYSETIEQGVLAERLGYDSFFVAEHHFSPYGTIPNPAVFLSHLAAKTSQIRLGPAISVLSYHPAFEVAENYAMLDILSGGRVTLGIGSGYLARELAGYGVDLSVKRERYDEAMEILHKALDGERFSHSGKHFQIDDMMLNVTPIQQQGLPIYIAVSDANVAYHVGKQGNNMMFVPYSRLNQITDLRHVLDNFRNGHAEFAATVGSDADDADILMAFHVHVANTDEAAHATAKEPFELYLRTRERAKHQEFSLIASEEGLSLIGSVESIAKKVVKLYELGVRHVMLLHNFGNMPAAQVQASIRLFAEEVMPRVNATIRERELDIA
ncbi:MAG: LLM class flavin-dependent oxidoreductase [Pigmentiphaga sp.]